MKHFITLATLAGPSVASASTRVSTNGTTNDAVGHCISASRKYTDGYENRGEWKRMLTRTYEGGVHAGIEGRLSAQPGTRRSAYNDPTQP